MVHTDSMQTCRICGAHSNILYQNLRDRLFGAPGEWTLRECSNHECGLLWLDPMPDPEDLGSFYETYYTHDPINSDSLLKRLYRRAIDSYLARYFGYKEVMETGVFDRFLTLLLYLHPGARAEAEARVMNLPAKPGGLLLEVGFGSAQSLSRMQSLGWNVQGVEFDPVAVDHARSIGLNVYQGDLCSQNFKEASFDAVVSSHVIEHLHDPEGFLTECYRLLKPGGTLVAYAPNSRSLGRCLFGRNWLHLDVPRHLYSFNTTNLATISGRAGFREISCCSTVRGGGTLLASFYLTRNSCIRVPLGKASRLFEEMGHYLSWASCKFNKNLGEELVLIAHKAD